MPPNAKESIEQKIRTERLTKSRILSEYEKTQKLGVNHDVRKDLYEGVKTFDMASLREFHNSHISSGTRVVMVLGSRSRVPVRSSIPELTFAPKISVSPDEASTNPPAPELGPGVTSN